MRACNYEKNSHNSCEKAKFLILFSLFLLKFVLLVIVTLKRFFKYFQAIQKHDLECFKNNPKSGSRWQ